MLLLCGIGLIIEIIYYENEYNWSYNNFRNWTSLLFGEYYQRIKDHEKTEKDFTK